MFSASIRGEIHLATIFLMRIEEISSRILRLECNYIVYVPREIYYFAAMAIKQFKRFRLRPAICYVKNNDDLVGQVISLALVRDSSHSWN